MVFAGAGVSIGEPARLPSFHELAREIAQGRIPWKEAYSDQLDRYLGLAEREGVNVQARARAILRSDRGRNPLHEHLLGIFGEAERVRLITTNFDGHFASALAAVFPGNDVPQYVGPALPPGSDFKGVAQLHGALDWPHDRLVLTDKDFAAAYMAEGWAARFLVRAFSERAVLFVGYSVSDPLIQYLLHALPPSDRWFGLWHESEVDAQDDNPIVPIPFDTSASGDRFGDLNDGMARWHWTVRAPPSDHAQELARLVSGGPPTSPLDSDYVRARLATQVGRELFWAQARDEAWFEWVVEEGLLDPITDPDDRNETTPGWGHWCLAHHCGGPNPRLLRFLRTRALTLQPWFLAGVIRHLCVQDPLPPAAVLRQLVTVIASQPDSQPVTRHDWQWLLERLVKEGAHESALLLLRTATRVRLEPPDPVFLRFDEASESDPEDDLRTLSTRVTTFVPPGELHDFLEKSGAVLASSIPAEMLTLAEQRIAEAYAFLDGAKADGETMDWLSYGRTSIAPSSQDRLARGEDVLVTLTRVVLEHLADTATGELERFIDRYGEHPKVLFRRLAIFACSASEELDPDEAIRRTIASGWFCDTWVRPELYRVLTTHYPKASAQVKSEFIQFLKDDKNWGPDGADEHATRARFSIAQKLSRLAPDDDATQRFAGKQVEANPEFTEGDPEGFLSRMTIGWGRDTQSPITANELTGLSAEEALDRISGERELPRREYEALLGALREAVSSAPTWGIALLSRALEAVDDHVGPLEAIFWGLRDGAASEAIRIQALGLARDSEWPAGIVRAVGRLLGKWSSELGTETDPQLLDALDETADLVYERSNDLRPAVTDLGWTEQAINHPAGEAAQTWWRVADARDWVDGQFVISIDDNEKSRWRRIVDDTEDRARYARPILGMATNRLSGGDYPWAADVIFPGFDTTDNTERAVQMWDGRLSQHRWSWTVVEAIRPYLGDFLTQAEELVPHRSEDLGDWMAFLVANVRSPPSPRRTSGASL